MGKFVGLVGAVTTFGAVAYLLTPLPPDQTAPTPTAASRSSPSASLAVLAPRVATAPGQTSAPKAAPPEPAVTLVQQIQTELHRLGCYNGTIDGQWSDATQRAMQALGERLSLLRPVDTPDYIMLALARGQASNICATMPQRAATARSFERWTAIATPAGDAPVASELKPTSGSSRIAASQPAARGAPPQSKTQRPAATEPPATKRTPTPPRDVVVDAADAARLKAAREELNRLAARNRTTVASVGTPAPAQGSAPAAGPAVPAEDSSGGPARPLPDYARMGLGAPAPDPLNAGIDPRDPNAPALLRGLQPAPPRTASHAALQAPVSAADAPAVPTTHIAAPRPPISTPPAPTAQTAAKQAKRTWMRTVFMKMKYDGP